MISAALVTFFMFGTPNLYAQDAKVLAPSYARNGKSILFTKNKRRLYTADAETFSRLNDSWAVDKNSIYYENRRVHSNQNLKLFEPVLDSSCGSGIEQKVYLGTESKIYFVKANGMLLEIPGADPKTFRYLGKGLAQDQVQFYYCGEPLEGTKSSQYKDGKGFVVPSSPELQIRRREAFQKEHDFEKLLERVRKLELFPGQVAPKKCVLGFNRKSEYCVAIDSLDSIQSFRTYTLKASSVTSQIVFDLKVPPGLECGENVLLKFFNKPKADLQDIRSQKLDLKLTISGKVKINEQLTAEFECLNNPNEFAKVSLTLYDRNRLPESMTVLEKHSLADRLRTDRLRAKLDRDSETPCFEKCLSVTEGNPGESCAGYTKDPNRDEFYSEHKWSACELELIISLNEKAKSCRKTCGISP